MSGYTCGAWATACALLWACGGLCKGTQISASRRGACVLICIYATDPKKRLFFYQSRSTALQTDPPPIRKYVQWVHIGMQGGGVCIRKISGFVKVTSRSSPTKVRSQIFYVRTSEGHLLPNRAPQSLQCRGVPTGSALRAGALALAPIFTELRAGIGA